uniref:NADH dehydrogenase [ubiquinone] flavoprotein 3, mitochondrial n=1 Tax=Vespula pensylvanica TaxID=30213 RepID=A0A834UFC9_VESPE|nr:hypothetical protein H0235_004160 [Vespula pensylvanica]
MLHIIVKRTLPKNVALVHLGALDARRTLSDQKQPDANVPGLSEKCYKLSATRKRRNVFNSRPIFVIYKKAPMKDSCLVLAVGPGASKDKEYKNPEYFSYHVDSFAEAEVELEKYRLPAPSNKKPFKQ